MLAFLYQFARFSGRVHSRGMHSTETKSPARLRLIILLLWLAIAGLVPNLHADNRSRWAAEGQAAVETWLLSSPDESLKDEYGDFVRLDGSGFADPVWNIQGYDYLTLNRTAHFTRGTIPMTIYVTEGAATAPGLTNMGTPVLEGQVSPVQGARIFVSHPELHLGFFKRSKSDIVAAQNNKKRVEQMFTEGIKRIQFDRAVQRWGDEGLTAVESWLRKGTNEINALCGDFMCFQAEYSPGEFRLDSGSDFGRGNKPSMRFTVRALFSRGYLPLTIIITKGRVTAPGLTNVGTPVIDGPVESHTGARILVPHPEICVPDDFQFQDMLKFLAADGEAKLARSYKLISVRKQKTFVGEAANVVDGGSNVVSVEQLAELRRHPCTLELRADHTLVISNYPVLDDPQRFVAVPGNWSLRAHGDLNSVQFKMSVSGSGEVKPGSATCDLNYPNNFVPHSYYLPGLTMLCRDESGSLQELWFKATNPIQLSGMWPNPHFVSRPLTNRPPNWDTPVYASPETYLREAINFQRKKNVTNDWYLANMQVKLADLLRKEGKLDEAETNLLQAEAVSIAATWHQGGDVADAFMVHARILMDKHDWAGAETAAREAVDKFPPQHYRVRESYELLNQVLAAERKPLVPIPIIATATNVVTIPEVNVLDPNSVENLQRVVEACRQQFGNESTNLADTLGLLSSVLRDQGKLTEAETARRENLAIRRKALGNEDARVATSLDALGSILQREGKLAEAETSIREALAIRRKFFGNESSTVLNTLNHLNEVLKLEGKPPAS
jgi:tetratricopeptide (TPR) repeat protein